MSHGSSPSAPHPYAHSHAFAAANPAHESRTLLVVILTAATMVAEIAAGLLYGSMALLADGWHMGTHVLALGITLFAYRIARLHARNDRFTFGTGKVGILGGFASAVTLALVAILMAGESLHRFFDRTPIHFDQSILVAVVGLAVNVVSAFILESGHHSHGTPEHGHAGHAHDHGHGRDLNLRAAYVHVLADALTSVLAIAALLAGKYAGLVWLDPLMGVVGALMIMRWAIGLLRETGAILLDAAVVPEAVSAIRQALGPDIRIADLHVWKVGADDTAVILAIVSNDPAQADACRDRLAAIPGLTHINVEVHPLRRT